MLDRLITSLTRPKLIGRFIVDKAYMVLSYFCLMLIFVMIPATVIIFNSYDDIDINYSSLKEELALYDYEIEYKDGFLTYESEFSFQTGNTSISFGKEIYNIGFSYLFEKDSVSIYYANIKLKETEYLDLDIENFSLTNPTSKDIIEFGSILSLMYTPVRTFYRTLVLFNTLIANVISYLLFAFVMVMLCLFINQKVIFKYKFKIVMYSLTPLAVGDFLATCLNASILYYIGAAFAMIYAILAITSIVKIEYHRK